MENALASLLALSAVAVTMVMLTVLMHAVATTRWMEHLARRYVNAEGHLRPGVALPAVIWSALVLILLHALEVLVWALAYHVALPGGPPHTFEEAAYFSIVTFSTLGFGDVTLHQPAWRILSGIEALNGILLVGWSTALLYAVIQRVWSGLIHHHRAPSG